MKKAIVIGATSGIGRGLAKILSHNGYKVGITGRRTKLLKELKSEKPDSYIIKNFDVTDTKIVAEKLDELKAELGGLDLLIVNSGIGEANENFDFEIEKRTIDTNVVGFTCVSDWAFRVFEKQKSGHLTAISSVAGLRGNGQSISYNATKAYQINYLEGIRQKAKKLNYPIFVTDIRPGFVNTNMAKGEGLFWVATVEKAARQIFEAILKRKQIAYITRRWLLIGIILRIIPRQIYDRV